MKKSKTEIALIWDAIHGILVRNQNTDMMLEVNSTASRLNSHDVIEMRTRTTSLESEVVDLMRCDAAKDNRIEDLERRLKKREEIVGRLLTDISTLATDYMDLRTIVDSHTNLHAMDNDLFKAQSNAIEDLRATVASLVADKDALISHNRCRSQRENELQAQVDELQAQVDDQFEAIGRLSTGMENVAKSLTNLDGWLNSVEVALSALRKST